MAEIISPYTLLGFTIFSIAVTAPLLLTRIRIERFLSLSMSLILLIPGLYPDLFDNLPAISLLLPVAGSIFFAYIFTKFFFNFKQQILINLFSLYTWLILHYFVSTNYIKFISTTSIFENLMFYMYFYILPCIYLFSLLNITRLERYSLYSYLFLATSLVASYFLFATYKTTSPSFDAVGVFLRSVVIGVIGGIVAVVVTPLLIRYLGYAFSKSEPRIIEISLILSLFGYSISQIYSNIVNINNILEQLVLARYGALMLYIILTYKLIGETAENSVLKRYESFFDFGSLLGFILIPLSIELQDISVATLISTSLYIYLNTLLYLYVSSVPAVFIFFAFWSIAKNRIKIFN